MDKSLSRYYARKIWEAANGPIPQGHQLHHKDGDPFNNAIDNLIACTPEQHVEFHRQLGHKIQPNFIARADAFDSLSPEEKEAFRAKCSIAGKKGRGIPKSGSARNGRKTSRPLEMIETKTGKIVGEFSSVSEAAEKLGIQRAHLRRVIKKERKGWHDYHFRYKHQR